MQKIKISTKNCKGCGLCIAACKRDVIILSEKEINQNGYRVAAVKSGENCIQCACCAIMCPDICIEIERKIKA